MGIATLIPNLRAAFRERLLTLSAISHAPGVSVSLASGVFTRASGSWIAAGFLPGQEITVTGFTGSPLYGVVAKVEALTLTTDIAGAQTVAGGGGFAVALPQGRAWEGFTFTPVAGRPYCSEAFSALTQDGLSVGNSDGTGGTIQHRLLAAATFFYPHNRGTAALEHMVGAAHTLFRRGAALTRNSDKAAIANTKQSGLYRDGENIACALQVNLLAHTQS